MIASIDTKKGQDKNMTIKELNPEQLATVKQNYYIQKQEEKGEKVFMSELVEIDRLVSDSEIFEAYADTIFTEDDF